MAKRRISNRAVVSGGTAIGAVFLVIALYAGVTFWRARTAAVEASANALPKLRFLSAARSDVRRMTVAMDEAVLEVIEKLPVTKGALIVQRQALEGHLQAYRALPQYEGEPAAVETLLDSIRRFDGARGHMLALIEVVDWTKIRQYENSEWSAESDQLDQSLQMLIEINAAVLGSRLLHLEQISSTSIAVLAIASFLGLMMALFAIRLALRNIRLYEETLEVRAGEWELFSARLAHDLMSPLQVVSFALNRASELDADERGARLNVRATEALRRVREITDALLNFARAGGGATPGERTSVPELVDALGQELLGFADEHAVELRTEPIPGIEVACSAGMLHVILSNLLRNAIKHMGDRPTRRVTLRVFAGRRVRFEVEDTGPGLDPGAQHHIFQPFVRRTGADVAGIGLGLATVKRTVEAYGGSVGVSSVKGQGSRFWVELPAAPKRAPAVESTSHAPLM